LASRIEAHASFRGIRGVVGDNTRADPPHVGDRVLDSGGGEPGIEVLLVLASAATAYVLNTGAASPARRQPLVRGGGKGAGAGAGRARPPPNQVAL
jgi:hypothetical protein